MQLVCPFFSQGLEGYNLIKWRTDSLLTVRKARTCRYFSQCFQLLKSWMKGCYFVYLLISAKRKKSRTMCVWFSMCISTLFVIAFLMRSVFEVFFHIYMKLLVCCFATKGSPIKLHLAFWTASFMKPKFLWTNCEKKVLQLRTVPGYLECLLKILGERNLFLFSLSVMTVVF